MKYLKLYENYNQFYSKISKEEYEAWYTVEPFTDDEINDLKKITNSGRVLFPKDGSLSKTINHNVLRLIHSNTIRLNFNKDKKDLEIDISKLKDEWFLVEIKKDIQSGGMIYKCDQFEGLVKLIQIAMLDQLV